MPNWENVEDASPKPHRVWLARTKDTEDWKPLRKCDCRAINESTDSQVIIEGGRFTVDKTTKTIKCNFYRCPDRMVTCATWFVVKDHAPEKKQAMLEPIDNEVDSSKIESLYQMAIAACTSFGEGIDSVVKEQAILGDTSTVQVVKTQSGNALCIKKYATTGWMASGQDLQRGYGSYDVPGEENDLKLGPVRSLIFVVHGIGEAMWTRDGSNVLSLLQEVDRTRVALQQRQIDDWKQRCGRAKKVGDPNLPAMPNRIEMVPIEWYDVIHSSSNSISNSVKAATLPTIPALRAIANDAVFDALMYSYPTFCGTVLDAVSEQINTFYDKFMAVHPKFVEDGGKCSLIGHSLGSVICWDLLSLLKDAMQPVPASKFGEEGKLASGGVVISTDAKEVGYQAYATSDNAAKAQNGTWGPSLPKRPSSILPFEPEFTVFLGSPVPMFLALRGAHPVFDEMRRQEIDEINKKNTSDEKPKAIESGEAVSDDADDDNKQLTETSANKESLPFASPFQLPTKSLYNIFHPSDPVAYRLEPLLLSPDSKPEDCPAPVHLTAQGQDVRLHIKAQQLGDEIGKFLDKSKSLSSMFQAAVSSFGKIEAEAAGVVRALEGDLRATGPVKFPLGGKSDRVDFQLQIGVVDNQYLSAVSAHSNYFINGDFQEWLIGLTATAEPETNTDLVTT